MHDEFTPPTDIDARNNVPATAPTIDAQLIALRMVNPTSALCGYLEPRVIVLIKPHHDAIMSANAALQAAQSEDEKRDATALQRDAWQRWNERIAHLVGHIDAELATVTDEQIEAVVREFATPAESN